MRLLSTVLAALLLSGCATSGSGPVNLAPVAFDRIPGWTSDATDQAFTQFRHVCERLSALAPDESLGGEGELETLGGTPADFAPACLAARQVLTSSAAEARAFFEHWFAAYDAGETRFTGYFEPEFAGSLTRGGAYQTPILARPPDLVTVPSPGGHEFVSGRMHDGHLVPYATRAEIDWGALAGRGLELLWLADPVDLFFLQLQGSGRIRLPSGEVVRVGFAGKNGQPYVPLGRLMVERNLLAPADDTPRNVRDWLEDNKARARSLIEQDPNYVFFRVLQGVPPTEGAPGTLGVPLSPMRSVAVGHAVPLATPLFYDTAEDGRPLRGLALAEDISGDKGRTEIFFGWGRPAEHRANALSAPGHQYLLLPRPVRPAA